MARIFGECSSLIAGVNPVMGKIAVQLFGALIE